MLDPIFTVGTFGVFDNKTVRATPVPPSAITKISDKGVSGVSGVSGKSGVSGVSGKSGASSKSGTPSHDPQGFVTAEPKKSRMNPSHGRHINNTMAAVLLNEEQLKNI